MIEPGHPEISVRRQCKLLDLNRSTLYYQPAGESAYNLHLMRLLGEQYMRGALVWWEWQEVKPEGALERRSSSQR